MTRGAGALGTGFTSIAPSGSGSARRRTLTTIDVTLESTVAGANLAVVFAAACDGRTDGDDGVDSTAMMATAAIDTAAQYQVRRAPWPPSTDGASTDGAGSSPSMLTGRIVEGV